tara:strand:- start:510 stop:1271 length:762 start_codon:yes stop_codon:yes gene_type:complete
MYNPIDSLELLSREEMNIQLETTKQTNIDKLDKDKDKEKLKIENDLLRKEIINFKNDLKFITANVKLENSFQLQQVNCYDSKLVNEYIDMVNIYITILDSENKSLFNENNKLEKIIEDLKKVKKDSKGEYSVLEDKYIQLEEEWKTRDRQITEKCINKNKLIYRLNCLIVLLTFNFMLIKYYGFYNYLNIVYFTLYYPVFYLSYCLKIIINNIYYLIENTINLVYNNFTNDIIGFMDVGAITILIIFIIEFLF